MSVPKVSSGLKQPERADPPALILKGSEGYEDGRSAEVVKPGCARFTPYSPGLYFGDPMFSPPKEPVDVVRAVLDARKDKYGPYSITAAIIQRIEEAMKTGPQYDGLSYSQKESLHMIANKMGRILNGDPNHKDSWIDIAGYATLAVDCIEGKQ